MGLVLFFITILFIGIGFSASASPIRFFHPLSTYALVLFQAIVMNWFLSFLGSFLLVGYCYLHIHTKQSVFVRIIRAVSHGVAFLFIGFFLSFVGLFLIAWGQLTIFSFLFHSNDHPLGIVTNKTSIVKTLALADTPPVLFPTDGSLQDRLVAMAKTSSGTDNFYGRYVLSAVPSFLVLPLPQNTPTMLLLDNNLILSKTSPSDIFTISPVLGYQFVKKYFWNRKIARYPALSIMNGAEYQQYRQRDAVEKLKKIDTTLAAVDNEIASLSAAITDGNATVAENKTAIQEGLGSKNTEYKACTVEKKNVVDCKPILEKWDAQLKDAAETIVLTTKNMQQENTQLAAYKGYHDFFTAQKNSVQTMQANIPHELGVFEPPKTIKLLFDKKSAESMPDYLETLTHEYVHYASFISEKRKFSNLFFEEGLTEYFSRNIVQQELETTTNIGYPVQVKIIAEMTKLIPESELADIYFSKNDTFLEKTLDRVYGDGFFQSNSVAFETLQYTSDPNHILKIANDIMKKIGGKPFTLGDVQSSFTH